MNDKSLEESLEKKLEKINIPTREELISRALESRESYGILFADNSAIKYATLDSRKEVEKIYKIKEIFLKLRALLCTQKDIYIANETRNIYSLFGTFTSATRWNTVESLVEHRGKILDTDGSWLFETLTNTALIAPRDLADMNVQYINSLSSFQNKLYALVRDKKFGYTFMELNEDNGKYSIGDKIIRYGEDHNLPCQAIILPRYPSVIYNDKKYDFSVLSCAHLTYLDLNGKMIEGTEEEHGSTFSIHRLALWNLNNEKAEVIYAGDLYKIKFAEINLKNRTAKTKTLIPSLFDVIHALDVVRNKELDEKLRKTIL